jgi:hypothetical protein
MRPQRFAKHSLKLAASCLLALTLIPAGVAALPQDDLALFSMRGVIIKMKDGREIAGYVVHDPNLSDDVKFPQVLLDPNLRTPELYVYTEVYPVHKAAGFPEKRFVTTEGQRAIVQTDEVAKIIAVPRPHDGSIAYWAPPLLHSPEAIKWLAGEKPQAAFKDEMAEIGTLISYNREIGEKELSRINEQIKKIDEKYSADTSSDPVLAAQAYEKERADFIRQLERRRVVLLVFCEGSCC